MKMLKKILSAFLAFGLVVGMFGICMMLNPVTVKAITVDEITANGMALIDSDYTTVSIPAKLEVKNWATEDNGNFAYIPKFNAYIAAVPVTSGIYYPVDYMTSHPTRDGKQWITGTFNVAASANKFGDTKIAAITSTNFGFSSGWFSGLDDGTYRYRIYFCDDAYNTYSTMFTIPEMTGTDENYRKNTLFLDFYVNNNALVGVVLVDGNDNKVNTMGTAWSGSTAAPGTNAETIKYNVMDITIQNIILGKGESHYHFYGTINKNNRDAGPSNFDLDKQNDNKSSAEYESANTRIKVSDTKGDFSYVIKNYPIGWGVTYTQDAPEDISGRLEVYTAIGKALPDKSTTQAAWETAVASNGYTKTHEVTVSEVTSTANNNLASFVSVAVIPLPPTGITTTIIPFIILIILAGGLLTFFIRKRDNEG